MYFCVQRRTAEHRSNTYCYKPLQNTTRYYKLVNCTTQQYSAFNVLTCGVRSSQVRSACTPRWQPCVTAQATLYKKKHYLPVMKATNSDSKRCQVSVDVSFQSPSCFQRKKAHTFSSQAKGGRPHRLLLGGVPSKQRRNHLLQRQRFDVCSKFPTLNCDNR